MTREEAIEILKAHHMWTGEPQEIIDVRKENKALEMAIQALSQAATDIVSRGAFEQVMWERDIAIEQLKELGYDFGQKIEPCTDAVSREAVLNIVSLHTLTIDESVEAVKRLPSVTQKSGWIPVSERLPEDAQEVLYSTKTGCVFHGEYYDDNTDRKWFSYKDDIFSFNNVVNAWMPLPEPYKAESEERNESKG